MSTVASLALRLTADIDNFNRGMDTANKKFADVGKKMKDVGGSLMKKVSLPLAAVGAGFLKSAMDLEATEAKFNTVFEGMTDTADSFISKFRELTPATEAEARSMASGIQDLLIPMGFMREEATQLISEFMHVTGALANFNSGTHSAQDVASAMQSAILGQYQSLAALGIQLNATEAQQRALEMGLISAGEEMTKQIRTQVVLAEVYRQSGDALTAYTAENLDTMTALGLLEGQLSDVAAKMGSHLLPIVMQAIDTVKQAAEWFKNLTEGQQRLILILAGVAAALPVVIYLLGSLAVAVNAVTWPVALVVAAVAGLAAAWLMYGKQIKATVLALKDYVVGSFELVVSGIQSAWHGAVSGPTRLSTRLWT